MQYNTVQYNTVHRMSLPSLFFPSRSHLGAVRAVWAPLVAPIARVAVMSPPLPVGGGVGATQHLAGPFAALRVGHRRRRRRLRQHPRCSRPCARPWGLPPGG
eukprot:2784254-Pyramimonas_sp.AAC.1